MFFAKPVFLLIFNYGDKVGGAKEMGTKN